MSNMNPFVIYRLNELENTHIDIEAAEVECREAIMRVKHVLVSYVL